MRRVLTVCVLVMLACSSRPPRRPEGLPATAAWIGKGAQGRFVDIGARNGVFWTIQVFEAKGPQNATTRWRIQGFARTSLEPQEIVAFEDGNLILNDGSRLVPAP